MSYDTKSDIWSIGVLTYELMYNCIPFEIRHPNDMLKIVEEEPYYSPSSDVSKEAIEFMRLCLQKQSSVRPSAKELLKHSFLVGGKKSV
jgi:serine/threonine protein kinase